MLKTKSYVTVQESPADYPVYPLCFGVLLQLRERQRIKRSQNTSETARPPPPQSELWNSWKSKKSVKTWMKVEGSCSKLLLRITWQV